jgi:hypothetical protein
MPRPRKPNVPTATTVRVVVLKAHVYDRVKREPGEEYEARRDMVRTLTGTGFVRLADPAAGRYERRDMRAEP